VGLQDVKTHERRIFMRTWNEGKQILAKRGKELAGDKFQEYFISYEEDKGENGLKTTYMEHDKVYVFESLDEALQMLRNIYNDNCFGWYPLAFGRWNEGRG
jgi:hypothetical protein